MILQIARAQKKIGTFIKTNNEWLLSDFFNSSEEIASGKMSPRPVIKVIWGERHISELSSSHHQTTMYTAPAPLFSTNFPSKKARTQNGPENSNGSSLPYLDQFFQMIHFKLLCMSRIVIHFWIFIQCWNNFIFKFLVYHVLYISKNGYTIVNNV